MPTPPPAQAPVADQGTTDQATTGHATTDHATTDHVTLGGWAYQRLARPDGAGLAFRRRSGRAPTVVFLHGLKSDMTGTKAAALEDWCARRDQAFVRFDCTGHGLSTGAFEDGTIGRWAEDALAVIDHLTEGPLLLVGSSMGAWLMLLAARARPERLAGLVAIAGAPDFTEALMWPNLSPEARHELETKGVLRRPSRYSEDPYPITLRLIQEGRAHLVLEAGLDLTVPVRLLHGMADPDVPWRHSLKTLAALRAPDVQLILVKDGDHRLSRPQDIALLCRLVDELSERWRAEGGAQAAAPG